MNAPDSNPCALYNLELCDFCSERALTWTWLTPPPYWVFQPHSSMTRHDYNFYRVCENHGAQASSFTLSHTPLDKSSQEG